MYKNNFDFLRHFFALCVVIAHCFPLSGISNCDWLCQLTKSQLDLSQLGVKGFFIISGYLIFQSLERSSGLLDYYWKRFLRLFPGLLVVLIVTVCFLPLVYSGSLHDYFTTRETLTYIPNNLILYKTQYIIPGIFETNPYKSTINGSLWTISYEFTFYVLLSLLFFFRKNVPLIKVLLSSILIVFLTINLFFSDKLDGLNFILMSKHVVDLGYFFIAGSVLSVFKFNQLKYINVLLLLASLLIILSINLDFLLLAKYFTLPIIVIGIGVKYMPKINKLTEKTGDLSYGIYIYGFLVQQVLMHYLQLNFIGLLIGSLTLVPLFAYLSWHIVEKRALRFKNYFTSKPNSNS